MPGNTLIFNSFPTVIIGDTEEGLYKNSREEIKLFLFEDYIPITIKASFTEKECVIITKNEAVL